MVNLTINKCFVKTGCVGVFRQILVGGRYQTLGFLGSHLGYEAEYCNVSEYSERAKVPNHGNRDG